MWTCPKCQTQVEPSFDVCWACGTTREGVEDPNFLTADEAGPIFDPLLDGEIPVKMAVDPELPEPPVELVECYRAPHITEAKFLVDQMHRAGIAAIVQGEMLGSNDEWMNKRYSPCVMVRVEDADRARAFVEEFVSKKQSRQASGRPEEGGDSGMWTCPKCQAKVDETFEVCWRCGTTPEGVEDPSFVPADQEPPAPDPLDIGMPEGNDPIPVPTSDDAAELVEAYWAMDLMQAKFLADRLTEVGIPAVSDLHDMHEALGSMSSAPRVWVHAADLPRARAWLEAYEQHMKSEHGQVE